MQTVAFPEGETGSTLFRAALAQTVAAHPQVFQGVDVPSARAFKKALPRLIGDFEARRAASPERATIAGALAGHVAEAARFGDTSLADALPQGSCAVAEVQKGTAAPGWTPEVTYAGRVWRGAEIGALADRMLQDHMLTRAAADGLQWVARELLSEPLVLRDQRFALLGAGAELAPTAYLLQAGATVLWVDRATPSLDPSAFAGTLVRHDDAGDLLAQTPSVAAALRQAVDEGPLHLGLFAYAPGKGRELLLTVAMNALAEHVDPASVAMLVSPTTPGEVQLEDRAGRSLRRASAPRWQRALCRARLLPEPAYHEHGDVQISTSIVSLQGPTYLAAQYLAKMMVAEDWAVRRRPLRVSANVAGITHTRSLEHPLFIAGFLGAPAFGVAVFQPEQTRVLNTLLMLRDVLDPDAPAAAETLDPAERARRVAAQSIHGGVRSLPFVFEQTIRAGALLGLAKKPSLLAQLRG